MSVRILRSALVGAALLTALATRADAQVAPTGGLAAATLKLPDGPGSVAGLAKPAEIGLFTGQVEYAVPIKVPSVGGMAPTLAIGYSGALGNGPIGIGWTFGTPAIRRSLRDGVPRYDDSDELTIEGIGGGRLVRTGDREYAAEGAGCTLRVRWMDPYFEVTDSDGTRYVFGHTAQARQADGGRTAAWFLEEVVNLGGRRVRYEYQTDRGQVYPRRVLWGPGERYRVEVDLIARADETIGFGTGFAVTTALRIQSIRTVVALPGQSPEELARYTLRYADEDSDPSNDGAVSRLVEVAMTGRRDADGAQLPDSIMPPSRFTYASPAAPRRWGSTAAAG